MPALAQCDCAFVPEESNSVRFKSFFWLLIRKKLMLMLLELIFITIG
jgi:hypothetical protein